MSPPYCGLPRLSHQLPVPEVVVGFVEVGAVLTVVSGGAVVLVVVVVVVTMAVDVAVVDVLQEARTSDITMRQVSAIQIVPLFMSSSCYLMENRWKIDFDPNCGALFYSPFDLIN
jgi:hypothetical protein